MSRRFGVIRQIAFVVRDLERARAYWSDTLGVGPFFVLRELRPDTFRYRGAPSPPPAVTIALANSGDVQVELIQPLDDRPSAYRDFLASGREGLQHVSSWLTRAEYDAACARLAAAGVSVAHEGAMMGGGVRFAYFATDAAAGGVMYEIADVAEPAVFPMMRMIADAAREWDGSDPVRELRL
ncbi:MAG: VOC family protein [Deltaproteobacteria bacterium]|nr:VOC family protein [Deltaproteobacteria bacterium]